MKLTIRYSFLLFHSYNLKQTRNHQMTSSRAKARPTQSHTCVKYWGIIFLIRKNTIVHISDLKIFHKKKSKKSLIFQMLSSISSKCYVFCLQLYAWLESCAQGSSFGTKLSGSLIFSQVLWILSSRNTLSVTHLDTASYENMFLCNCWGLWATEAYMKHNT